MQRWLTDHYPGGLDGVDSLMMMASLLSDRFAVAGPAYPEAAAISVLDSLEKWLGQ